ncbi:fluoride efflux transporter FluC [Microbacterium sp. YY-01]|uniref:fluoride efflux transporter FluC n=1 Tax=Microbacterium sp. YY-01 TaxID=3421634 RepID=UPI003D165889
MILLRALLVAAGGTIGAGARITIDQLLPDAARGPLSVLIVNVLGSFVLGVLIMHLQRLPWRLFVGTGVLGGFTTYSAFAVDVVQLWQQHPAWSTVFALGSVVAGLLAAYTGVRVGESFARRRPRAGTP